MMPFLCRLVPFIADHTPEPCPLHVEPSKMSNEHRCRWCQKPVVMSCEDEDHCLTLCDRVYRLGYEALTEDQQALVLFGPLCEECVEEAGLPQRPTGH